jgi:hypothetical protein
MFHDQHLHLINALQNHHHTWTTHLNHHVNKHQQLFHQ